ncbi:MAG: hypothetical protein WBN40_08900 [Pseudomonadales bacterium]
MKAFLFASILGLVSIPALAEVDRASVAGTIQKVDSKTKTISILDSSSEKVFTYPYFDSVKVTTLKGATARVRVLRPGQRVILKLVPEVAALSGLDRNL